MNKQDPLDDLPDDVAAAAFRRLVHHLRHRHDAQNIDLMGLSGFCRNCLADWIRDAGYDGDKAAARALIHGMPMEEWKATRQTDATQEQLDRMATSLEKNGPRSALTCDLWIAPFTRRQWRANQRPTDSHITGVIDEMAEATDDRLRLLIERIERLEEEKKGIADDIRDVYAEAKAVGYDAKIMRQIVRLRKMEPNDRSEQEMILDTYKAALGMG